MASGREDSSLSRLLTRNLSTSVVYVADCSVMYSRQDSMRIRSMASGLLTSPTDLA